MSDRDLTYREAAEYLGVKVRLLRDWVSKRKINAVIYGHRTVRFRKCDLDRHRARNLVRARE